jgi:hypothetical protein
MRYIFANEVIQSLENTEDRTTSGDGVHETPSSKSKQKGTDANSPSSAESKRGSKRREEGWNDEADDDMGRPTKKQKTGYVDESEIEEILNVEAKGRGHRYLIRWKGSDRDSWVPSSKVKDSKVLAAWHQKQQMG